MREKAKLNKKKFNASELVHKIEARRAERNSESRQEEIL